MTLSGQTKRGDMTSGNLDLFKMALGLEDPWKVTRTDFNPEGGRLDLYLDFPRGAAFLVPSRWLRPRGVSGADLVQVLAERHVADPMESVLDGPVTAQRVGELVRTGLGRAQRGDRIDRLGGPPCAVQAPPATDDLDRLRGVRKAQSGGDGGDFRLL